MNWWLDVRTRLIPVVAPLLGVAAIAGAVVLTPSHRTKSDLLENLRQDILERSQVDLFDDFNQGLDAWKGAGSLANTWTYDTSGFVHPGPLALFEPSMRLTDYDVDAQVQIQEKAVGFAFRALSLHSYQVAKLVAESSGPMSSLAVQRYTVVSGQASPAIVTHYPERFPSDTLYQVHLEVRGDAFSLYVQGKLLDYWLNSRLPAGGVGLLCSTGEHARVAWIRVSHNTDSEGRICSWLSSMLDAQLKK